jgi:hypothetical protein
VHDWVVLRHPDVKIRSWDLLGGVAGDALGKDLTRYLKSLLWGLFLYLVVFDEAYKFGCSVPVARASAAVRGWCVYGAQPFHQVLYSAPKSMPRICLNFNA